MNGARGSIAAVALHGRIALVTGAARGIGEAAARQLAAAGARVVLTDSDPAGAAVAERLLAEGARAEFMVHDVVSEADWEGVFAAAGLWDRPLDILVNNAGVYLHGLLEETTLADIQRVIAINLLGVVLGTRLAARSMKDRPRDGPMGSIVNVSSVAGLVGAPMASIYGLTKGGVRAFTKATALEFAALGYRIRCNSLHPGLTRTAMSQQVEARLKGRGMSSDQAADTLLSQYPIGRLAEADEIARGIVYLASDESSFMTGAELVLDGGYTAR